MVKIRRLLLMILTLISISGCVPLIFVGGGIVGAGVYKAYEGKLTVIYEASLDNTWNASQKALGNLGMTIKEKEKDKTSGYIKAIRSDKKTVNVWLTYKSMGETKVEITIGVFGDKPASELLKDEIKKELFG